MTKKSRIAPVGQPRISVTVSPQAFAMIERLTNSGLWGRDRAAVVREMIYRTLREHLEPMRLQATGDAATNPAGAGLAR